MLSGRSSLAHIPAVVRIVPAKGVIYRIQTHTKMEHRRGKSKNPKKEHSTHANGMPGGGRVDVVLELCS